MWLTDSDAVNPFGAMHDAIWHNQSPVLLKQVTGHRLLVQVTALQSW